MSAVSPAFVFLRLSDRGRVRRGPKLPTDPKWEYPKLYAVASVVENIGFSMFGGLFLAISGHPVLMANQGYALWATYQSVRNLKKTFDAARMEADHRLLGRDEQSLKLPVSPSASTVKSFNMISHGAFVGAVQFMMFPTVIPEVNSEDNMMTQNISTTLVGLGLTMRALAWLEKKKNDGDNDRRPPPSGPAI